MPKFDAKKMTTMDGVEAEMEKVRPRLKHAVEVLHVFDPKRGRRRVFQYKEADGGYCKHEIDADSPPSAHLDGLQAFLDRIAGA